MNIQQFTIAMLARGMWRAGFLFDDVFDPKLAVLFGHVIRNRVQAAAGQVGWLEVLDEPTLDRKVLDSEHREVRRAEDPDFLKILWEAERLYLNQSPDLIDGALAISLAPREGALATAKSTTAAGMPVYFYKTP